MKLIVDEARDDLPDARRNRKYKQLSRPAVSAKAIMAIERNASKPVDLTTLSLVRKHCIDTN
jgi:hypothetical protein